MKFSSILSVLDTQLEQKSATFVRFYPKIELFILKKSEHYYIQNKLLSPIGSWVGKHVLHNTNIEPLYEIRN